MVKKINSKNLIFIVLAVIFALHGAASAQTYSFQSPSGVCVSSTETSETIFVTDKQTNKLVKFSSDGQFMEEMGENGSLPGQFNEPSGLSATSDGQFLYLADKNNHRIQKIKLNCPPDEVDRFIVKAEVFDVNTTGPLGFMAGNSTEEGGHIELTVTAVLSSGEVDINYSKSGYLKPGKLLIDEGPGMVTWEGLGITCDSVPSTAGVTLNPLMDTFKRSSSIGSYDGSGFVNGVMKLYVRCTESKGERNITVLDAITGTKMRGAVTVNWTAEDTPPALSFIGSNKAGFRKYTTNNDPGVTFIKIPASSFERGDGTYGGGPTEIKMSTYYIAETPTTNAQFKKWRDVVSTGTPVLVGTWASKPGIPTYANHPAVFLEKEDAKNYSYWLITGQNSGQTEMYHVSEDQHEKAMRGAKLYGAGNNANEKLWPWGNTWDTDKCNENTIQTPDERIFIGLFAVANGTTRVTRYPEMGYYGLRDITGNCWYWLRDNANLVTGGSWYNGGLGSDSYRCSFRTPHSPGLTGGGYDGIRPCFYWPVK